TRAIVDLAELRQLGDVGGVIDHLVQARLLVVQTAGETETGTVEIVHESLLSGWPTLRRWLDESQEDAAFLAQLRTAAKQWDTKGRPAGLLWRGEIADEARHFHGRYRGTLPALDHAFLGAVIALATRSTRVKRATVLGAMVFLALIAAGAMVLMQRARGAEQVAADSAHRAEAALAAQI